MARGPALCAVAKGKLDNAACVGYSLASSLEDIADVGETGSIEIGNHAPHSRGTDHHQIGERNRVHDSDI